MAEERGLAVLANSYFTTPFRKASWEQAPRGGMPAPRRARSGRLSLTATDTSQLAGPPKDPLGKWTVGLATA